jgi:hypothetical protein
VLDQDRRGRDSGDLSGRMRGQASWNRDVGDDAYWYRRFQHRIGEPSGPPPDGSGAPRVEVPLDAIRVLSQPCAALSPTQLKAFNVFKPGTRHLDGASGPGCDWRTDEQPAPPSATCACLPGTSTRPRPSELLRTGVGHAR